ncbi:MAG: hypothetical protein IJ859_03800 [Synergistaceae bacterium]|nr:hypothetical protein [Synergistaceae bacterium]
MKSNSRYFCNRKCEYYPCHSDISKKDGDFNCLFCFCPLYKFEDCGGNFQMLPNGIKDCSDCLYPHNPEHYDAICRRLANA